MRAGLGEKENKGGGGQRQDIGHVCEGEKQEKKKRKIEMKERKNNIKNKIS